MSIPITGISAAAGSALAPVFLLSSSVDHKPDREKGSVEEERKLLSESIDKAVEQLNELTEKVREDLGAEEASIFEAHALFAADPAVVEMANGEIDNGERADIAVDNAFASFKNMLLESGDEYYVARAADMDDVSQRVQAIINGVDTEAMIPTEPSVIVAEELTPSQTASLPKDMLRALVTEKGSATSHAAILARALSIPAIVGATGITSKCETGTLVGINGSTGEIIINPDESERDAVEMRIEREERRKVTLEALVDKPGSTKDGYRIELAANIGSPKDFGPAQDNGAEGSGLVRSELVFQGRKEAPTAEEQAEFYKSALQAFPGNRVVVRTMDVGADKPLPFVEQEKEDNPALGVRGVRLSLQRPDLFEAQIRGLLMAHKESSEGGRLAIMFPMVSVVSEFRRAKKRVVSIAKEMGIPIEHVEIGMMIEIPVAALLADQLAEEADFFSVGTNDLVQYLFAADRLDSRLAKLAQYLNPAVIRLLNQVVVGAKKNGIWVGICGESASDPIMAVIAAGLGIKELSMTASAIGEVKDTLRNLTMEQCNQAAEIAMKCRTSMEVKEKIGDIIRDARGRLGGELP